MKKRWSVLALILALLLLLSACGGGSSDTTTEVDENETSSSTGATTLTVGTLGEPDSLYPPNSATGGLCLAPVYESLMNYNYETGELDPCLATSWEFTDDTTLVFQIREGVQFSDGSTMDANDVLFSFQKYMEETTQTYSKLSFIDIENCYVEDDYTVVFKFTEPTASGLVIMATCGILSEDYYKEVGENQMSSAPMCTGPYELTEWTSGYSISYAKNESYWGDACYFDEIVVRFYSESTTMMIDYETDAIDVAMDLAENDVTRIQNDEVSNTQLYLVPTFETYVFTLYNGSEKLQDERVRQAIAHAIDRDAVAEHCLGVLGSTADSVMASSIQYYISCDCYEYDPELSISLLEEAGVENLELTCLLESDSVVSSMAEIIQAELNEVGITLNIEIYDIGTVITKWIGLENDMVPEGECVIMASSLSIPDPDYRCTGYKQGSGLTIIEVTDELNDLLFEARQTLDEDARREKYEEVQQLFVSEAYNNPVG
ncbi:MAG: ABC transporter substrate-binding protein [Oscillospiraceae bacterium]|nr:ABC transporter substrate-binding protein [Oscillospiraceae bacterium]